MAIILPGFVPDDSLRAEDVANAERATTPPRDCAKQRRFIFPPREFENASCQSSRNCASAMTHFSALAMKSHAKRAQPRRFAVTAILLTTILTFCAASGC